MAYQSEDWIERTHRVAQALREERERVFGQQEKAQEDIRAVHRALEAAGVPSMTGEEIVEMIRQMREERINEILRNVLGAGWEDKDFAGQLGDE